MGIEVMKLMAEMLKDKDSTKKKVLVSVELIDRGSVSICSEKITIPA
jgi:DNA-binding LacI/PurR family transcriptional regulator